MITGLWAVDEMKDGLLSRIKEVLRVRDEKPDDNDDENKNTTAGTETKLGEKDIKQKELRSEKEEIFEKNDKVKDFGNKSEAKLEENDHDLSKDSSEQVDEDSDDESDKTSSVKESC